MSTAEAKYIIVTEAVNEGKWLQRMLFELEICQDESKGVFR